MQTTKHSQLPPQETIVGCCLDDAHPEKIRRYQIAFTNQQGFGEKRWLEAVQGVSVKRLDRVLLVRVRHLPEPIILASLGRDDDQKTPEEPKHSDLEVRGNNTVVLHGETPIQIVTHEGRKLAEIGKNRHGPCIRVCQKDMKLDLPGKLSLEAGEIELKARKGDVRIEAEQEVIVEGELIRLN
jgi:hypothetical protein